MKINIIKTLIVVGLSLLLGLICYEIAKETDNRNIISAVTTFITVFMCLGAAFACDYNRGNRNANIKVTAWIFSVIVLVTNIIFACFSYNIIVYVAVVGLLSLINVAIVYLLYSGQ